MVEFFDEVFEAVMEEMDMEWWEVLDSSAFRVVVSRIVAEFGEEVLDSEEYEEWVEEMSGDL